MWRVNDEMVIFFKKEVIILYYFYFIRQNTYIRIQRPIKVAMRSEVDPQVGPAILSIHRCSLCLIAKKFIFREEQKEAAFIIILLLFYYYSFFLLIKVVRDHICTLRKK